jgi:hypothetical protein
VGRTSSSLLRQTQLRSPNFVNRPRMFAEAGVDASPKSRSLRFRLKAAACPAFKRLPGGNPGKVGQSSLCMESTAPSPSIDILGITPRHSLTASQSPYCYTCRWRTCRVPFLHSVSVSESGFCAQLLIPPFHSTTSIWNSPEPALDLKAFPSRAVALRIDLTPARTGPQGST